MWFWGKKNELPEPQKSLFKETLLTVIIAFFLALFIRTFLVQVFFIPSESMTPTLKVSDRIMVSKINYFFSNPARFESVVFSYPRDPSRDFVKRIVGLPGEHLEVRDGFLFINDKRVVEKFKIFRDKDNFGPVDIPGDCYFVMGDNRCNSSDSRVFGYLPRDYIIGKAVFRIWPMDRIGVLEQ